MNAKLDQLIDTLVQTEAHVATRYVDRNTVVRATRVAYKRRKFDRRSIEVRVHIGKPNYLERDFIKKCQKAGEKFPVRKVQLRFLRARKKT